MSGLHLGDQPVDELLEFLALMARFAAQHRNGHVAELRRVDAARHCATARSSRAG